MKHGLLTLLFCFGLLGVAQSQVLIAYPNIDLFGGNIQVRTVAGQYPSIPLSCGTTTLSWLNTPIVVGESATRTYIIRNIGEEILRISDINVAGASFSAFHPSLVFGEDLFILPGNQTTFSVTFAPNAPGNQHGVLTIRSSSRSNRTCQLNLVGRGLLDGAAALFVRSHDWKDRDCGDDIHLNLYEDYPGPVLLLYPLRVSNFGLEDLVISGTVTVSGSSQVLAIPEFTVGSNETWNITAPISLPGHQITTVVFNLVTNDPNHPTCTIYLYINQTDSSPHFHNQTIGPALSDDPGVGATLGRIVTGKEDGQKLRIETLSSFNQQQQITPVATAPVARLYPTVTNQPIITLEVDNPQVARAYFIADLTGRIVQRGTTQLDVRKQEISISGLEKGIHYLRLEHADTPFKFIIQ